MKCGLYLVITCQYWFINSEKKSTILMLDINNRESYVWDKWKLYLQNFSKLQLQFQNCKSKTILK